MCEMYILHLQKELQFVNFKELKSANRLQFVTRGKVLS